MGFGSLSVCDGLGLAGTGVCQCMIDMMRQME